MNRFAVILFIHQPDYQCFLSETIPLKKKGSKWVCPDGKLNLSHLGLQRADGEQGIIVEVDINEPVLHSFTDYFVFVGETRAEADTFAAGCLAMRSACELCSYRMVHKMMFSNN